MTTFNYTGTFRRVAINTMNLPAHMVATLIADKLGQTIPIDNRSCLVNGSPQVTISYDMAVEEQIDEPLTITLPDPTPPAADGKPMNFSGTTEADLS
jgi:hypothetical protein